MLVPIIAEQSEQQRMLHDCYYDAGGDGHHQGPSRTKAVAAKNGKLSHE